MNNIVQSKNTPVAGRRPTGLLQGELYFNFGDRTIGCVDANGVPVDIATAIPVSALAPENAVPGMLWFNISEDPAVLLVYAGSDQPDPWITVSTSVPLATLEQALEGLDNETVMTPFLVRQVLDVGGAGSSVSVGDAPPDGPAGGQLWFKTSAPVGLFLWFQDVDSGQWVQVGGGGVEPIEIVKEGSGWQVVGNVLTARGGVTTLTTGPVVVAYPREFANNPTITLGGFANVARSVTIANRTATGMEINAFDTTGARIAMTVNWVAIGTALPADQMPTSVGGVIGLDTGGGSGGGGGGGGSDSTPVGTLIWHTGTAPPEGYLVADGSPITATHPELRDLYLAAGSPFGVSGAAPRLPNLTTAGGRFVRAALNGAGVGVTQADAFQLHGHRNTSSRIGGSGGTVEGLGTNDAPATGTRTGRVTVPVLEGTGGTPRVDTETRPVNIALLPCVKAVPGGGLTFATEAEARAGVVTDKVVSPALVRALSGSMTVLAPIALAGHTFTGIPDEATEVDLLFEFLGSNAAAAHYIDLTLNDLITGYTVQRVALANGVAVAGGDLPTTAIRCEVFANGLALAGRVHLQRAPFRWIVDGKWRSPPNHVSIVGATPNLAALNTVKLTPSVALAAGGAMLRWRI